MQKFFARPHNEKAGCAAAEGPGCQVGFMINGQDEIFESKVHHDPRWPWPGDEVRTAVLSLRELLHTVALSCLRALCPPLGLDTDRVNSLLDQSAADGDTDLEQCSNTTMRIYRYAAHGLGNNVHTDNGFLTVAPAGSAVGLQARVPSREDHRSSIQPGEHSSELSEKNWPWLQPEPRIAPGQLLVFAGDALSFLTAGKLPALVHWVDAPPADEPRYSTPFFLRPRLDAILDPASVASSRRSSDDGGASGTVVELAALARVRQRELEANLGNVRRSWPWKQDDAEGRYRNYYEGTKYPNDDGMPQGASEISTSLSRRMG